MGASKNSSSHFELFVAPMSMLLPMPILMPKFSSGLKKDLLNDWPKKATQNNCLPVQVKTSAKPFFDTSVDTLNKSLGGNYLLKI